MNEQKRILAADFSGSHGSKSNLPAANVRAPSGSECGDNYMLAGGASVVLWRTTGPWPVSEEACVGFAGGPEVGVVLKHRQLGKPRKERNKEVF